MGQNQSSDKPSSRGGTPHDSHKHGSEFHRDKDRRVNRRISVQALAKREPADVSASNIAAQGTTTQVSNASTIEKMLQSTSPELAIQGNRTERSTSRRRKDKDQDPNASARLPIPSSVPVSGIDIPGNNTLPTRTRKEDVDGNGRVYDEAPYAPVSHHRPPRLPLPIAEVPDSPNLVPISKTNSDIPIFSDDAGVPRRNSMMSVATQEEEDVGEELQPFGVGYTGQTVPYTIEWKQGGDKVFVTGTFAAWDKKYRLRKSESRDGYFKTVINLPPGTHHLKFFVDNNMMTSPDLPTAVDFNNILVNYIEISTEDIPKNTRRESGQIPIKSMPYPASPRPETLDTQDQYSGTVTPGEGDDYSSASSVDPNEEVPEGDFRRIIPQALVDIDLPEDDAKHKQAAQIITDSNMPPSLPLFLSRSILNAGPNVGVKDDSSVLAMPNHTVLNHLMTSNVRNGVLATSVTTRYKKKYVTTISFKPVPRSAPFGSS